MICAYPLDDAWMVVQDRIQAIIDEWGDFIDYTIKDVYQACKNHDAEILNSSLDSSFAIVKVKTWKKTGEKILFIWISCSDNGSRDRNIGFLKEIAVRVGATKIVMESPRHGFDRFPGWKRGMTTYIMEV